ncbi:MAG: hypothetical protein ACK5MB_12145 [Phycisphaerales bacterium]|jgi:hypothetical protein
MSTQPNQTPLPAIPTVQRRDPITAEVFNALGAAIAQVREQGVAGRPADALHAFALLLARMVIPCRITTASHNTPTAAGSVTYTVTALGERFEQANMTPYYGRPSRGDDWVIHPSVVGDLCFVVREVDSEGEPVARLWILREQIAPDDCVSAGGEGGV